MGARGEFHPRSLTYTPSDLLIFFACVFLHALCGNFCLIRIMMGMAELPTMGLFAWVCDMMWLVGVELMVIHCAGVHTWGPCRGNWYSASRKPRQRIHWYSSMRWDWISRTFCLTSSYCPFFFTIYFRLFRIQKGCWPECQCQIKKKKKKMCVKLFCLCLMVCVSVCLLPCWSLSLCLSASQPALLSVCLFLLVCPFLFVYVSPLSLYVTSLFAEV